jgi:hypothetical protein
MKREDSWLAFKRLRRRSFQVHGGRGWLSFDAEATRFAGLRSKIEGNIVEPKGGNRGEYQSGEHGVILLIMPS